MKKLDDVQSAGRFQKVGLILAVAFYILSVIMVIRNHGGMSVVFSPDTKVITIAHWQLEDGFREGISAAIEEYEKAKLAQGVKVKVRQVAVPVRGYQQWYLTQLIGGEPADILEVMGSSDIQNQYFTPLSPYIGEKNPWNKGTPLENMSWRESFADDMLSALDTAYSEFFSVCTFMHTTRVYVNMKLYEEATRQKRGAGARAGAVLRAHAHGVGTGDDAPVAGQAQAALQAGLLALSLDDLGVHELDDLALAVLHDAHAAQDADLRRGQPDGVGEFDAEDLAFERGVFHGVTLAEQPPSAGNQPDGAQQYQYGAVRPLDGEREEDGLYDATVHGLKWRFRLWPQRY